MEFINLSLDTPYQIFKKKYEEAARSKQAEIEAMCISSYSIKVKEVRSRFVNLKYINDKNFIFFSNYKSQKSEDFSFHKQISAAIYWSDTNVQIRLKGFIDKTNEEFNNKHFKIREKEKNALAISSQQSHPVKSYDVVEENYIRALNNYNSNQKCPKYWGGFTFVPYYFEFWEGHESRLNKREVYEMQNNAWNKYFLQP